MNLIWYLHFYLTAVLEVLSLSFFLCVVCSFVVVGIVGAIIIYSKGVEMPNDLNVNSISINNKSVKPSTFMRHLLCPKYLKRHHLGRMDTMEFHYKLTKIKRLRHSH